MSLKTAFAAVVILMMAGAGAIAANEALTANLVEGTALKNELNEKLRSGTTDGLNEINQKLNEIGRQICEQFAAYLPGKTTAYGDHNWHCKYNAGTLFYTVTGEENRQLISVQVIYHEGGADPKKRGMYATLLGYPAQHIKNQSISILLGKTELRMTAIDPSIKNDQSLLDLLQAFDLKGLSEL